jgi:glucose-6-phosphate 1-dehydrogenase
MARPDDHVIVMFGATGDLAKRKLLPGLFHLAAAGLLPRRYRIIGSAPAAYAMTDAQFRAHARDAVRQFGRVKPTGDAWTKFARLLSFAAADDDDAAPLLTAVAKAEDEVGGRPRRLFHLAVPPVAFSSMIRLLGRTGLADRARVIIEKPFGTDLASAKALNATVHAAFDESQVFRIDHFLGKESVDNILALRFANGLFEPIWNREHIRYVQIDVPESLTIEGRAAFYEGTGAFRDMVVTHLFQVLGFVGMEPPTSLDAKPLRDEKIKVFESLQPLDVRHIVRGQYRGYRKEPGVRPRSDTETFVALRAEVDNWRWAGVPFYLRTGKALAAQRSVITLGLRQPTLRMFPSEVAAGRSADAAGDEIVIDFADPGSIAVRFQAKEPGPTMRLGTAEMTFDYADSFVAANDLEGYERLILEAMLGDQALFTRSDGIERLWEVSMPLLDNPPPVQPYAVGSWGPAAIHELIAPHRWYLGS